MIKTALIILSIIYSNLTLASENSTNIADIIDPPSSAALNIMVSALTSLKELKNRKKPQKKMLRHLFD